MGLDLCCMTNRIGDDDGNSGFFRLNTLLVNLQYVISMEPLAMAMNALQDDREYPWFSNLVQFFS